tara:strand:- start:144 stop:506 length:363 start_codon:yes stop_codon:yes gene_type:complete
MKSNVKIKLNESINGCAINPNREARYRDLVTAEIDAIVSAGPEYLWLITSGFKNADDCCPDGWNHGGYWEFVYTSIASNLEDFIDRRGEVGDFTLSGILSDYAYEAGQLTSDIFDNNLKA